MSEPVKINIPASVAAFVRPGTPLEERLRGAGGAVNLPPRELLLLLFCLGKDSDTEVRRLAVASIGSLDPELVVSVVAEGGWHPAVLHSLALACGRTPAIISVLLASTELAAATRDLLQTRLPTVSEVVAPNDAQAEQPLVSDTENDLAVEDAEAQVNEEDGDYLSKYQLAQELGIGEKIKMALTGDKEWRKILVKDANKLVSAGVIKNPRMSEPEVLTLLKSGVQNDEIMRLICANKEWVKNYQIRKALIENPKTPLANALRYLGTMNDKDVASYAKSRNISSVIATQAKRLLLNKKR